MKELVQGVIEIVRSGTSILIRIGEIVIDFVKALVSPDMIETLKGFFNGSIDAVVSWFHDELTHEEIIAIRDTFFKADAKTKAAMVRAGTYKLFSFEEEAEKPKEEEEKKEDKNPVSGSQTQPTQE